MNTSVAVCVKVLLIADEGGACSTTLESVVLGTFGSVYLYPTASL